MAQDYNFYIHYTTEIIDKNKTIPNVDKPNPTVPSVPFKPQPQPQPQDTFKPITIVSKGSVLPKVGVSLASAILVYSLVDKGLTLGGQLMSGYGGNYELQHNRSNFKSVMNTILNPLSIIERNVQAQMENYQDQVKKEQELLITGNGFVKGS